MAAAVENILKTVDSMYPGLLAEGHTLDILQFTGAINPLVVQVQASAVESAALLEAVAADGFQAHMIATPGLQINKVGGKHFVASLPPGGVSLVGGYKTEFVVDNDKLKGDEEAGRFGCSAKMYEIVKTYFNTQSGTSLVSSKTGLYVRSLSDDVVVNINGTHVFDLNKMLEAVPTEMPKFEAGMTAIFNHFGVVPELAVAFKGNGSSGLSGTNSGGEMATYPDSNGEMWAALLQKYSLPRILMYGLMTGTAPGNGNVRSLPCIPGYSRVFIDLNVSGTGASWCLATYVKGDAWQDILYGQHPSFHKGGHYNKSHRAKVPSYSFPSGRNLNDFPVPQAPTAHALTVNGLSYAELTAFTKRNGNTYSSSYVGCTLFGAPYVDLMTTGAVVSETVVQKVGDIDVTLNVHEVHAEQFRWVIPRDWYKDYLTTGYKIFTPRASNIQTKVLSEWDALAYNELVLRGLSTPYKFTMTVNTLPEARVYAKGRAKACKDNDWLKQMADQSKTYTWGEVKSKSDAFGPRAVFLSPQNSLVGSGGSIERTGDPVVYSLVNGQIQRVQGDVTVVLDSQNEDDRGVILYDKYFGKVTLSGTTWDKIIVEDELELESMSDTEDFNFTTSAILPGDSQANQLFGFGSWIDPFPKGDIRDLNDEQLFRLHIKNLMELDKMTAPLIKILNSFGYETITKFAKK